MSVNLADQACEPCRGQTDPMDADGCATYLAQLDGWSVVDGHHLVKSYAFPDFVTALAFTNAVGALAEEVGHHPDILLRWGQVEITLWTHSIDGLHPADFILAAKMDRIQRG